MFILTRLYCIPSQESNANASPLTYIVVYKALIRVNLMGDFLNRRASGFQELGLAYRSGKIRIISARMMTRHERKIYEEG